MNHELSAIILNVEANLKKEKEEIGDLKWTNPLVETRD